MWSGILIKSCDRSPTYGMTRTNGYDQLSNRGEHDAKLVVIETMDQLNPVALTIICWIMKINRFCLNFFCM